MSHRPSQYQQGHHGDRHGRDQGYHGRGGGHGQGHRGSDRPPQQYNQPSRPRGPPGVRTNVMVTTNCFQIESLPTAGYIQYDVTFVSTPPIPESHSRKRTELMHHLQNTVYATHFPHKLLYDGGAIAYAHPALTFSATEFLVRLRDSAVPAPGAPGVTTVRFRRTNAEPITATEINQVVVHGEESHKKTSLLNFMQLLIRQSTSNMNVTNGKAYFPKTGIPMDRDRIWLESRLGIFHSVRPAINKLVIVVDSVAAAFYQGGDLPSAMLGCLGKARGDTRALNPLSDRDFETVSRFFKGLVITEKKHPGGAKGGRRTIKGFHPEGIYYEFDDHNGHPVTIKEHYKRTYNTDLTMNRAPGVIVRKSPRLEILPLELCYLEPDQMFKRTLPTQAAQKLIKEATKRPDQKLNIIMKGSKSYQNCEVLQAAGMSTGKDPLEVPASIIPAPNIAFKDSEAEVNSMKGAWNLVGHKFFEPAGIRHGTQFSCRWGVLNFAAMKLDYDTVSMHVATLEACLSKLGVKMEKPMLFDKVDGAGPGADPARIVNELDRLLKPMAKEVKKDKFFFLLCFLDDEALMVRKAIKRWGDVMRGVVTQCVRYNKLPEPDPRRASQYWNNVALKINSRLGGINSKITGSVAYNLLCTKSVTMIVGADVGHPGPGVRKPSVASVVWSFDQWATKYGCISRLQDPRTEVIADLEEMMVYALKAFFAATNDTQPTNIIFYRDGVSEGEFETIANTEIPSIRRAIQTVWDTTPKIQNNPKVPPMPKLTFLVVGKRHRTLFFTGSARGQSRIDNCPAGLVVNKASGITQPTGEGDYYLLSHGALLGTSRSSHYTVLCNEVFPGNLTHLEDLSFDLCHLYAKATRSVSIPAPVYYADLACARHGIHLPLNYDDSMTIASGDEFNLEDWKKHFDGLHSDMNGRMHFL